eukprot:m.231405 g.231405  ORF g.231405 m.231405 type:complete len:476 (-) comp18355_c0_seq1:61-1488(-)
MAAEAAKEAGNKFFKEHKFQHAIEEYTKAIELDPNVPTYYCNRAMAYIKLEGYGAAVADATKAIELDNNCIKAYYRRASANMGLFKFQLSLRDYELVLKVHPDDPDAKHKHKECDKIVKRMRFEKAIAVEAKAAARMYDIIKESWNAITVESSYQGPRLGDAITPEFMEELVAFHKKEGRLHRRYATKILLDVFEFFQSQPTLVDIPIPEGGKLTVCGDVHGQFFDLANIFAINGMPSPANPYLFNGDFVDRGSWSVEVILTLFGFKLLYPDRFFLARGNHETINMNKMYGFEGEVKSKYNAQLADFFTEIFNFLPLGHLIEEKVLVVHGGLPSTDGVLIKDMRAVDRNRQPPESGLMSDMLWSDPSPFPGRRPSQRGVGCMFGPDITNAFLKANDLKFVIRSHEVKDEGYEVMHDGKCITIFSAPNYCDQMGNKGAFITLKKDLVPKFTTFEAVPHPHVKPMAYASGFGGLLGF